MSKPVACVSKIESDARSENDTDGGGAFDSFQQVTWSLVVSCSLMAIVACVGGVGCAEAEWVGVGSGLGHLCPDEGPVGWPPGDQCCMPHVNSNLSMTVS